VLLDEVTGVRSMPYRDDARDETEPLRADRLATGRTALRAADPRMAELVDADPTLDPDTVLEAWPTDLRDALVFSVVGQQLSVAATRGGWRALGGVGGA
jgi:hypothetical protein